MAASTDRLSRTIARLRTQRSCLDFAAADIATTPGPILEVGLGKGRTYDRLRHLLPGRDIYVFDRVVHCPADAVPPPERLLLGDFREPSPSPARASAAPPRSRTRTSAARTRSRTEGSRRTSRRFSMGSSSRAGW